MAATHHSRDAMDMHRPRSRSHFARTPGNPNSAHQSWLSCSGLTSHETVSLTDGRPGIGVWECDRLANLGNRGTPYQLSNSEPSVVFVQPGIQIVRLFPENPCSHTGVLESAIQPLRGGRASRAAMAHATGRARKMRIAVE